jgi:hypothetical protein
MESQSIVMGITNMDLLLMIFLHKWLTLTFVCLFLFSWSFPSSVEKINSPFPGWYFINGEFYVISNIYVICLTKSGWTAYVRYCYYGSTVLCWALAAFSSSWSYRRSVGFLGLWWARHKASTSTQDNTNRINAHNTNFHAPSGNRTHNPSVRAGEDSSCFRPRGYCDRLM